MRIEFHRVSPNWTKRIKIDKGESANLAVLNHAIRDHEIARPRLIADAQRGLPVAPDPAQELFQRVEVVGNRPRLADLPGAPPLQPRLR